jgi:hypothetical protein
MKTPILLALVLSMTSCVHVKRSEHPSGIEANVVSQTKRSTPLEKWIDMRDSPEIERRAKAFEKQGESPGEARAAAEIEYYFRTAK